MISGKRCLLLVFRENDKIERQNTFLQGHEPQFLGHE